MSNRNPRERFDYKSWFERNVAKRTVAALEARDAEFAEKHADTPLAHLAQYVGNRAELLRHTPSPCEIDGGTFIEERFGGWAAVLEMAHLRPPTKEPMAGHRQRHGQRYAGEHLRPVYRQSAGAGGSPVYQVGIQRHLHDLPRVAGCPAGEHGKSV